MDSLIELIIGFVVNIFSSLGFRSTNGKKGPLQRVIHVLAHVALYVCLIGAVILVAYIFLALERWFDFE